MLIPFDSHVHCFPPEVFEALWRWFRAHAWEIEYPWYADDVLGFLEKQGVERAMVLNYAHKPGMADWLNQWTRALMQKYPQHLYFGAFHQDDENPAQRAEALLGQPGFAGVKLHAHVQGAAPDDERFFPLYEVAQAAGKAILFHCGTEPRSPAYRVDTDAVSGLHRLEPVLKRFGDLKIVVPHLGAGEFQGLIPLLKDYPNLYADTAMAVGDFLMAGPERFAALEACPEKILFGTDFPNIPYAYDTEFQAVQKRDPAWIKSLSASTASFMTQLSPV